MDTQSTLAKNLNSIRQRVLAACCRSNRSNDDIQILPVSKYVSTEIIRQLMDLGFKSFAENRLQVAQNKINTLSTLKTPPRWHFIGKLQKNKVNKVVGVFELIHSIDSLDLLQKIQHRAAALGIVQNILLQYKSSQKESKSGTANENDLEDLFERTKKCDSINCLGFMTMGDREQSADEIRENYSQLVSFGNSLFQRLDKKPDYSMGMSSDFEIAVEEGATILRIGTLLYKDLN